MIEQFNHWFSSISQRERVMVSVAGAFIVIAIVWLLGLQPLYSGKASTEKRVAEKTASLAKLQLSAANMQQGGTGQALQGLDQSLVVVIDRTTRLRQLSGYLKRNQPDGNNTVRLRLENAPFDDVVVWLSELRTGYGLVASSASFDLAGPPGRINCNLVLDRSSI